MTRALKPCPFCGGQGVRIDFHRENASAIECKKCGAGSAKVFHLKEDGWEHVVLLWNTRVKPADAQGEK